MRTPDSIARFLSGKRIAIAGVSRDNMHVGNVVLRKLRASGYDVVPINPNATEIEGTCCYPDLDAIEGGIDGLFIATHPRVATDLVRQCSEHDVRRVSIAPSDREACPRTRSMKASLTGSSASSVDAR